MARKLKKIIVPDSQGNPVEYDVGGVDADTASAGQVLKADGAGGTIWGDIEAGGDSVPTEVRQAIFNLLDNNAFANDDAYTTDLAVLEAWATTVTELTLNQTSITFNTATTFTLIATTSPRNMPVTWETTDASVATVNAGIVTPVTNGTCRIIASSGDKTATCSVTVTGIERTFTVSNNLTSVTTSNDATMVIGGDSYQATLTPAQYYGFDSVVITMGGIDITASVYSNGNIVIPRVTGDVSITAVASEHPLYSIAEGTFTMSDGCTLQASGNAVRITDGTGAAGTRFIDITNIFNNTNVSTNTANRYAGKDQICTFNEGDVVKLHVVLQKTQDGLNMIFRNPATDGNSRLNTASAGSTTYTFEFTIPAAQAGLDFTSLNWYCDNLAANASRTIIFSMLVNDVLYYGERW